MPLRITGCARLSVIQGVMLDFIAGLEEMQPSLVLAIHRDLPNTYYIMFQHKEET